MGTFNSPNKEPVVPALDELEKKIGTMNAYLGEGRAELERLEELKKNYQSEIDELQDKSADLKTESTNLAGKVGTLEAGKKDLEEQIADG